MKDVSMLVWLTQLGISVALPLAGFVGGAAWLHNSCGWGVWVIWVGIGLGLICAANGLRYNLKAMLQMSAEKKKDPPPPAFNDHD